jgi:hypothetical protein
MSHAKNLFYAISMLTFVGVSPAVSAAEPVDVAKLDTVALRALSQSPVFRVVCPLIASAEHSTQAEMTGRAAPAAQPMQTTAPSNHATAVVHEMVRNSEVAAPDGLDSDTGDFTGAGPSR